MELPQGYSIRFASKDDVDSVTNLHCACFSASDYLPMLFGRRYVRSIYRWHVSSAWAYLLVVEHSGRIVGQLGVCDGPFFWKMFTSGLGSLVLSIMINPLVLFHRSLWKRALRRKKRLTHPAKSISKIAGVAHMTIGAIESAHRGKQIFDCLVSETEPVSGSRGSRAIVAGVYKSNNSSRRVFSKLGWKECEILETGETVTYISILDPSFNLPTIESVVGKTGTNLHP